MDRTTCSRNLREILSLSPQESLHVSLRDMPEMAKLLPAIASKEQVTPILPAPAMARPKRRGSSGRPRTPPHRPAATSIDSLRIPNPTSLLLAKAYGRQNPSRLRSPATECPPPALRHLVPEAEIRTPL